MNRALVAAAIAIASVSHATMEDPAKAGSSITGVVLTAPAGVTYSGGDGSDCDHAVKINGTESTARGIRAERAWVTTHYPGFVFRRQSLRRDGERSFDVIDIETKEKSPVSVCFDITEFFGKLMQ